MQPLNVSHYLLFLLKVPVLSQSATESYQNTAFDTRIKKMLENTNLVHHEVSYTKKHMD